MQHLKAHNFGNPHLGLFARSSDRLTVADVSSSPKFINALESLGVPVVKATLFGSGLAGVFLAMNSNGAAVTPNASKEEVAALQSHGLEVCRVPPQFSAAGNNIAANDFGAVANPNLPLSAAKKISDCLGVEVVRRAVAGYETSGSCLIATNRGFIAHSRASGEELKELQSILRVGGENCTLNTGVPFVSLCAIANSKAALFGESSTGFEIGRASSALGIL